MTSTEENLILVSRVELARGVIGLTFAHPDRQPLPQWEAGAHIDLFLPDNRIRQYSLCGDVDDRLCYRIAVLRESNGRGGSKAVHDELKVGDSIRVGWPRNHFRLDAAPRYIFIAGGIGITPILPMIAAAETAGADWTLVYGGRSLETMAFVDVLARYGERVRLWPMDQHGLINLDDMLKCPEAATRVYCCGPEPLLLAVKSCCERYGWPDQALHIEHFAAPLQSAGQSNAAFEVHLARSGQTYWVPADRTILDVLDAAGVAVRQSCGVGTCGTCECRVLEGEPDHRDSVLTNEEKQAGQYMMICVSRSQTDRLVLDK